ncbi:hypothetical protein D9757_002449 [Collybiopsis confluens]|uniref:Uncharacterized protein n=1 Tax=Collybiopsis confluens TaxID=2823264 RepID=A0A8H5MF39_9AGAR|nr:hypothetical protein D9757_002449 [Collybiopsis confluens]
MEIGGRPPLEHNRSSLSGNTVYYDALPYVHMAQNPDLPIANGKEQTNLNREPTVTGGTTILKPRLGSSSPPSKEIVDDDGDPEYADEPDHDHITAHPNGSEGWLPATDLPTPDRVMSPSSQPARSGSVLKKRRNGSIASGVERSRSTRSMVSTHSRRSMFTDAEGRPVNGSTFINGAGTTGPSATAVPIDDSLLKRMETADSALTGKQKKKIGKVEAKEGKRLSKVIRQESKVEKQSLEVAIRELSELQKLQQAAVKRESKAHTAHTKALAAFQKAEEVYLAARSKYEIAQAAMQVEGEILEIARNNARTATESMQEKGTEVDALRTIFGLDERERAVALTDLKGKPKEKATGKERKGSGFWR